MVLKTMVSAQLLISGNTAPGSRTLPHPPAVLYRLYTTFWTQDLSLYGAVVGRWCSFGSPVVKCWALWGANICPGCWWCLWRIGSMAVS